MTLAGLLRLQETKPFVGFILFVIMLPYIAAHSVKLTLEALISESGFPVFTCVAGIHFC